MTASPDVIAAGQGTVVDLLFAAARTRPSVTALVCRDECLDYAGYARAVRALAQGLNAESPAGGRIATLLPNSQDACIAHFAVLAAGRQLVPLNPAHMPRELDFELGDAEPDMLLADTTLRAALMPTLERLGMAVLWTGAGALRLADALAPEAGDAPLPPVDPTALALLQYTGGTSGRPKGVELTHRALRINLAQREAVLPTRDDGERILCAMPLFHSYGMAMGLYLAVRCRGTLVILPDYRREALFDAVEHHAITVFPGSPTIYAGLLDHPRFDSVDWSSVRTCYSGAAALPVALMERWRAAVGVSIYEGYGQTEAGPVLAYNGPAAPVKVGSVGQPLPETCIEIVDLATGSQVLAAGETGEIRARGPQLMRGYRNRPEETAEALRDGWLYTGDIGEFDADGYLFIRDRKKDMVIVAGYNVYPREVEEVLQAHPAVLEAAVIGEADSYRGEVLHAFVGLRSDAPHGNLVEELTTHCDAQLVRYKRPARLTLVERLPKTSVNKTDKKALRAATSGTGAEGRR